VITPVIKVILILADVFLAAAQGIVSAISFVISPLMELNRMLGGVPAYILGAAVAWKVLSAAFAASPIGVVVAGIMALIAAIVLLKEDFDVWKEWIHNPSILEQYAIDDLKKQE
jgi:phosphotransferase system  glucose/maltose/N-acetylglucosamine-specific IIC component